MERKAPDRVCVILGAGAHVEYGMPTSAEFMEDFSEWANGQRRARQARSRPPIERAVSAGSPAMQVAFTQLHTWTRNSEDILVHQVSLLADQLAASPHYSIDGLLAKWPDRHELGKQMLAAYLLGRQRASISIVRPHGVYKWLARVLYERPKLSEFLDLVTFNYDTLGELHLEAAVRNARPDNPSKPPPIHHVYGSLQYQPRPEGAWYADLPVNAHILSGSVDSMKIADARDVADVDAPWRSCVRSARTIIALGFAFAQDNVTQLGLHGPSVAEKQIFATGYGVPTHERSQIDSRVGTEIDWGPSDGGVVECLDAWNIFAPEGDGFRFQRSVAQVEQAEAAKQAHMLDVDSAQLVRRARY